MVDADLLIAARAIVGFVLVVAGLLKLRDRAALTAQVTGYVIVPRWLRRLVSSLLGPVEILVGAALAAGAFMPLPALVAAVLLSVFSVAISVNLVRGKRLTDCGCFGRDGKPLRWMMVARNLLLGLIALYAAGVWAPGTWRWPFDLAPSGVPTPPAGELAIALVVILVAGALLAALREVALIAKAPSAGSPKGVSG